MPIVNGKIVVEARCVCGERVQVCAGTYGQYCSCGRGLLTNNYTDEINVELRKLIREEKLKIRKHKDVTAADFSVGASSILETCSQCGKPLTAGSLCIVDGELVCSSCVQSLPKCKGCNTPHFKKHLKGGLCEDCQVSFKTCPSCGSVYDTRIYKPIEVEGVERCNRCVEQYLGARGVRYNGYSYKPQPVFLGEREVGYYFGVELEMDNSPRRNEFMAMAHCEEIYFKSDGSLVQGVEVVSHPATLKYHMEEFPWKKVLSAAKRTGFKSHMGHSGSGNGANPTCGLHIHVSKTAFGRTSDEKDRREAKMLVIVDKFWNQLAIFSRRDKSSLETWARRYAGFSKTDSLDEIIKKAKGENRCGRRYAVNMEGNDKTVEFRLFRGTLNYETLIASIQLCDLLLEATKLSTKEVQNLSWEEFCEDGCSKYDEFRGYIERLRGMKKKI